MKNVYKTYLFVAFAACFMLIGNMSIAQNESDFAKFLQAEKEDASKLIAAYTSPAIKAVSYGMTNGWYTTGKAHSTLGFDVSVTMSAVFTPTSDDYFKPSTLGMKNTVMTTPTNDQSPAIFGPKTATSYTSTYNYNGVQQAVTFAGPQGLDLRNNIGTSAVPVPMVQVGIGLIKNTDLKVRFIPSTSVGASKVSMLGFGLLHDVKQHIPGLKLVPIDISILAAYNSMKGTTSLVSQGQSGRPDSKDGQVSYKLNSWVAQAIVSKKFSVLTVYGGIGYGSVSTNVDVTGTYTIVATPATFSIKDPASIKFSNTGIKGTLGLRLKLGPIYFSGDYTLQTYNALTLGFGVSVR